jgi:hypothetical protein
MAGVIAEPIGRVVTDEEQKRLLKTAEANPEWEHVWGAAELAANTSLRGVKVKRLRRKDLARLGSPDIMAEFEQARTIYVRNSKNETSKRVIPLNQAAFDAVKRMLTRAERLGRTAPEHDLWCANQHHKFDLTARRSEDQLKPETVALPPDKGERCGSHGSPKNRWSRSSGRPTRGRSGR